ncbi:phage tail collar domain-containing protein [Haemophilus haemolyticus M21127]|uniref:phage tail-collar fiber domain-containing protein n=1 Tax=Haemophilus haemolyticus TaxID=726 RepID=UPI00021B3D8C|nr:phage tail protein [Haemophilus haemolyticus]EGT77565.1 phage tail collar domain-containing protein [Haemophilus haemolyticus M21127]
MASQYFAILTDYGTRAIAHALSQGQPLQLTQFAVGDGNGQAVTPTASATALVHQTHIAPVSAVSLDPRNNKQVIVELTIPENVGGFYIREMGVFDSQNKLIAYANCPESFKPTESSGSGKVQVLRMILKVESSSAVTLSIDNSVIFVTRQQMTPKTITATTQNGFDESGHSHEIAKASTTQQGITQLYTGYDSQSEDLALTPKTAYQLKQLIDSNIRALGNVIPNSKKSSAVDSNSADTVATSAAVKTAYDLANSKQSPATTLAGYGIGNFKIEPFVGNLNTLKTDGVYAITQASRSQNLPVSTSCHIQVIAGGDGAWCRQLAYVAYSTDVYERHQTSYQTDSWSAWKKLNTDGIPVGAVVSFPRVVTNPVGFLKANGTTFNQQTFPDLYQVLGNSNKLPDLTRSDVGMTAYFAVDNIPTGWIAFDDIATQVTEQRYPELYRHLVGKYGSIASVPKVADRFLRNAGNGLSVGQTQEDAIRNITGKFGPVDGDDRHTGAFRQEESFGYGATLERSRWWVSFDASRVVPVANENRPKSLILKLCIKAINSFDDVVFWIKSHGEVTNAGTLDAGRLAQGLQDKADRNHTHTASQITDFNQATSQIINAVITYQKIGNFEIRKYPDGTMIQSYLIEQYDLNGWQEKSFNWAQAFISTPMIFSKITTSISGQHDCDVNILTKSNNRTCYYHEYEHGTSNQGNVRIEFLAMGRWKQ